MTRIHPGMFPVASLCWMLLMPINGWAIPAFSRQIHADCRTCHFQGMYALNKYGRAFKKNGFRESDRMREQRLQQKKQKKHRKRRDGASSGHKGGS